MNFLAHLYLADDTPGSLIGSLLPDLVRGAGRTLDGLDPEVEAGALRHRRIDVFTDRHPAFQASRGRIRGRHGIFSGILIDVFYDHFLSVRWAEYHSEPLPAFVAYVYRTFADHPTLMPRAMRPIVERMVEQDWLSSYASVDGLALTLRRMSHRFEVRFERRIDLATAVDSLRDQYTALDQDFAVFFPQAIAHVRLPEGPSQ